MRTVADTNIVVSGSLWQGPPRQVLDAARTSKIELFTTATLLAELEDVLQREKFANRLRLAGVEAQTLVMGYAALATIVVPENIDPPVIAADPDDDEVLACAIAANARVIVSGDSHLLDLEEYRGVPVLTARELIERISG